MQLTNSFALSELIVSDSAARKGITEQATPPADVVFNLTQLCTNVLQPLRDKLSKPIIVTSGYRCKRLNDLIGGAAKSQHLIGQAADIHCPQMTVEELYLYIRTSGVIYDQLIQEFDRWVHVSFDKRGNKMQNLRAKKGTFGRTIYLPD